MTHKMYFIFISVSAVSTQYRQELFPNYSATFIHREHHILS